MDKKAKILALLRKYYNEFLAAKRLDDIKVANENYQKALEAAEIAGFGDLAKAFDASKLVNSAQSLKAAKRYLKDADKVICGWFDDVSGFEEKLVENE